MSDWLGPCFHGVDEWRKCAQCRDLPEATVLSVVLGVALSDLAAERQRREEAEARADRAERTPRTMDQARISQTENAFEMVKQDLHAERRAHEATKRELAESKQREALTWKSFDEARRERDALRKTNHRHLCGCEESAGVFGCGLDCPCRCHGLEAELAEVRRKTLEEACSAAVSALCDVPMCDDPMCPARGVTLAIRQLHSAPKEGKDD